MKRISKESYDTWFKHLDVMEWDHTQLRLSAPNRYVKQWIENHYQREVLDAAKELVPETVSIEIIALPSRKQIKSADTVGRVLEDGGGLPAAEKTARKAPMVSRPGQSGWRGSQSYRLDTFVVGVANRLAYTACQTVVELPGTVYNPLILHGSHGLGKTHLLQGLAHVFHEKHPNQRLRIVSCEEFANDYINAIKERKLEAFRDDYRRCHVLLVDDIQFLSGKEKTQFEFLHTFDALINMGRQVVLTSTTHPRDIKRLNDGLKARLQAGLVARIDVPCFDGRVELLVAKARVRGLALSQELAELLAHRVECCVRELEGVVCKLGALCAAEGSEVNKRLVIRALRELGYLKEGPLTLDEILDAVVQQGLASADDIRSSRRHLSVVHARHLGMYLAKALTELSFSEIGLFFGNRDHSTVYHAIQKIEKQLESNKELADEIESLKRRLGR